MIVNCKECGKELSYTAPKCPHCGAPKGKAVGIPKVEKRAGVIIAVIGFVLFFVSLLIKSYLSMMFGLIMMILGIAQTKKGKI